MERQTCGNHLYFINYSMPCGLIITSQTVLCSSPSWYEAPWRANFVFSSITSSHMIFTWMVNTIKPCPSVEPHLMGSLVTSYDRFGDVTFERGIVHLPSNRPQYYKAIGLSLKRIHCTRKSPYQPLEIRLECLETKKDSNKSIFTV